VAAPVPNSRRNLGARYALLAALKGQAHRCEATRNIETSGAFDADWLQRDRIVGATHQHIGADPDPNRSACGCTSISAGQRSWRQGDCWGDNRPDITAFCTYPMSTPNFKIVPA
jgi:hypothetical protein